MWIQNILVCDKPALSAAVAALSTVYIHMLHTVEIPAASMFFVHLLCLIFAVIPRIPMVSTTTKGLPFTDLLPHLPRSAGSSWPASRSPRKTSTPLLVKTFVGLFVCAAITSVAHLGDPRCRMASHACPMSIANHLSQRAWKLALRPQGQWPDCQLD
ncbi:hypothetical protein J8273_2436 [Carpediemonas membranifera]|uniref:Uncharacterized protein n=1 Tax=Carpediemonas membranifera TaxID=201153 RepID=A0A8J6E1A0_9EUKA|nr:hypothetical protein J8273_2436 [Carpediemonas membranifera]|eukprot:KAG9396084.1 hypothetical protein J8273_2436 [Carpediemonas membranifera]